MDLINETIKELEQMKNNCFDEEMKQNLEKEIKKLKELNENDTRTNK